MKIIKIIPNTHLHAVRSQRLLCVIILAPIKPFYVNPFKGFRPIQSVGTPSAHTHDMQNLYFIRHGIVVTSLNGHDCYRCLRTHLIDTTVPPFLLWAWIRPRFRTGAFPIPSKKCAVFAISMNPSDIHFRLQSTHFQSVESLINDPGKRKTLPISQKAFPFLSVFF